MTRARFDPGQDGLDVDEQDCRDCLGTESRHMRQCPQHPLADLHAEAMDEDEERDADRQAGMDEQGA